MGIKNQRRLQVKFTDGFFTFPVRIYDTSQMEKNAKREDLTNEVFPTDWIRGYADIPLNEIKGVFDFYSRGRTVEEVDEQGFDGAMVSTNSMGEFITTWNREKFKAELNSFANKYQNILEGFVQEEMAKKQAALKSDIQVEMDIVDQEEASNKRRGFFSRWF